MSSSTASASSDAPPTRSGIPFRRSKTGCGTCKRRGKKCDEIWTDNVCERCAAGGWDCAGPSLDPRKRRGTTVVSQTGDLTALARDGSTAQDVPVFPPVTTVQGSNPPTLGPLGEAIPNNGYQWPFQAPALSYPSGIEATASNTFMGSLFYLNTDFTSMGPCMAATSNGDTDITFESFLPNAYQTSTSQNPLQIIPESAQSQRLKPMRQGVSLAEIYARVVESWLVGVPTMSRDYARARILALNDNNSAMRAVRYAVATAYIFLYAGEAPRPQHTRLVQLARQGAGATHTNVEGEDGREVDEASGSASTRLKQYTNDVVTPYAADQDSRKWTQDAIKAILDVGIPDERELSDLLWGVIDLQLVEFIRGGAAPSYNMLALGDRLVRGSVAFKGNLLNLSKLCTSETLSMRFYAFSDVSRCIVHRGRKTIFRFIADDQNGPETPTQAEPWSLYLGLPDSIIKLLADIVNLCADLPALLPTQVKQRADEIEAALTSWQEKPSLNAGLDPVSVVSRTIAGQLWKLSAHILLYQSVHRVGPLHPVLRHARDDILNLLDSIVRLPNGDLWGFIALPSFLAAGLSVSDTDRQRARKHMARCGPERVWLDNIALAEMMWEEMDRTGRLADWHDKMTREGCSVAFF